MVMNKQTVNFVSDLVLSLLDLNHKWHNHTAEAVNIESGPGDVQRKAGEDVLEQSREILRRGQI